MNRSADRFLISLRKLELNGAALVENAFEEECSEDPAKKTQTSIEHARIEEEENRIRNVLIGRCVEEVLFRFDEYLGKG